MDMTKYIQSHNRLNRATILLTLIIATALVVRAIESGDSGETVLALAWINVPVVFLEQSLQPRRNVHWAGYVFLLLELLAILFTSYSIWVLISNGVGKYKVHAFFVAEGIILMFAIYVYRQKYI